MELLSLLPHQRVAPSELPKLTSGVFDARKVYLVQVTTEDYISHDGPFDIKDFYANPDKYTSNFHETVLPYINVLLNGIYWDARYPRLITESQIHALATQGQLRLSCIGDISCDLNGSIAFTDVYTSIDKPFFIYNPLNKTVSRDQMGVPGIAVMSVENLPTQLPKDASDYFGAILFPFMTALMRNPDPTAHSTLTKALITNKGQLTPDFTYLQDPLKRYGR